MTKPPRSEGGTFRRHTRDDECPVCGGYGALPQGKGVRCAGFSLDFVVYCTREEHAGRAQLDIGTSPPAFKHLLRGECACGVPHGYAPPVLKTRRATPFVAEALDLPTRNAIYSAALVLLGLRREAETDLRRRGLLPEDIEVVGYRSVPLLAERERFLRKLANEFGEGVLRRCPGFTDKNGRTYLTAVIDER